MLRAFSSAALIGLAIAGAFTAWDDTALAERPDIERPSWHKPRARNAALPSPAVSSPKLAPQPSPPEQQAPATELPYTEGDPIPDGYELVSGPRLWMLVVGAVIFVPSYAWPAYEGLSGHAERSRAGKSGSGELMLIPVLGPSLFDDSFCEDAKAAGLNGDELWDACHGLGWGWVGIPQAIGLAMMGLSFAFPTEKLKAHPKASLSVQSWYANVARTPVGTPVWVLGGSF